MSLNTFPCNPYPISTEELNKGNNDDLNTRVSALETAVEEIDSDKADTAVIAPEFDAEAGVYSVGDLVMYQGKLYEFTTAHETAGDWDSTEVTEKTVADEVNSVKSGLMNFITITETVGDTINVAKQIYYPSGCSAENCVVLGTTVYFPSANTWIVNSNQIHVDGNKAQLSIMSENSAFLEQPIKIVLYKFA